ncbi:11-beta-hydroxysteroid dehydrogenase 1 [Carettochelys insculpta]|uniref:11-beta-hydroxysteroid dehydrogenase 1 n=1 Tax=Carettochelys insculpta TaxID=44489 RepID=UPI003EBB95DA
MGLLRKTVIPFSGLAMAGCIYSTREDFKPEMLKGKQVSVIEASSGIGEQMAHHLAWMGAHILVTTWMEAELQPVVTWHLELGAASAHYTNGSMEDLVLAEDVVKEAQTHILLSGGLDILILNRIGHTHFGYFSEDIKHVRKLLEINFLSYMAMTVTAPPMLKESGGSLIVVSSIAA